MQEKEQYISPIKQRILEFAATLGISKRDFYSQIGVSRGTLESKTGITEDIMAKFIATFPDISLEWLIKGKGDMVVSHKQIRLKEEISPGLEDKLLNKISQQAEEIGKLKNEIEHLKKDQKFGRPDAEAAGVADVV
ncbi:hypothetical protein [Parabacteroides sp. PF5-9]|uniref:hypothetical protein n=1 Tax=Parabacteroides sp. PF5-9 TaxID=1742404 RepID=UPI0024750BCF|nr:hypothetical protein [Parabacteroides sp. PF5-9]MDH6357212.1 hypothetical protein [Parabacteroides sp. PF5-9]